MNYACKDTDKFRYCLTNFYKNLLTILSFHVKNNVNEFRTFITMNTSWG